MIFKKTIIITLFSLQILLLVSCNRSNIENNEAQKESTESQLQNEPTEIYISPTVESNIKVEIESETVAEDLDFGKFDEYGPQYEKTWKSDDGRISFLMDNKIGFENHIHGYYGSYLGKSGKTHEIMLDTILTPNDVLLISIVLEDVTDNEGIVILDGSMIMDDDNKGFTIICDYPEIGDETMYCNESIYDEEGEKVHFHLEE